MLFLPFLLAVQYACDCEPACDSTENPLADDPTCVAEYELEEGEITDLLISIQDPDDAAAALYKPATWTDPASWATAIDNESAAAVHHLTVIGDVPAPEKNTVDLPKRQQKTISRTYTGTFDVMHLSDINYQLGLTLQCGISARIWYATMGGKVYGGPEGIAVTLDADFPKERGGAPATMQISARWIAKCDPPRANSPFSESDGE
jgi:hypothetical protein